MGVSRAFAGDGGDGPVKVDGASVRRVDKQLNFTRTAATACCYRAHCGTFGIVNSEEAYQNLACFLFGDIRVDIWLQVDEARLPEMLQAVAREQLLYQFELMARPRGKRWFPRRRVAEEDSPACRAQQLSTKNATGCDRVYLFSAFLANRSKVVKIDSAKPLATQDRTLAYAMDIAVRVPDYQVEKRFWPDQHFEGSPVFRDSLLISLEPPLDEGGDWRTLHSRESQRAGLATKALSYAEVKGAGIRIEVELPAVSNKTGLSGEVLLIVPARHAEFQWTIFEDGKCNKCAQNPSGFEQMRRNIDCGGPRQDRAGAEPNQHFRKRRHSSQ